MSELPGIARILGTERLGREIFSRRLAKRRRGGTDVPYRVFMGPESNELSVDLLDRAPLEVMTRIGDRNAAHRGPGRSFYAWAALTRASAEQDGRRVAPAPTAWNRFHAEIRLPPLGDDEAERLDARRAHARGLAAVASLQAPFGRALP